MCRNMCVCDLFHIQLPRDQRWICEIYTYVMSCHVMSCHVKQPKLEGYCLEMHETRWRSRTFDSYALKIKKEHCTVKQEE